MLWFAHDAVFGVPRVLLGCHSLAQGVIDGHHGALPSGTTLEALDCQDGHTLLTQAVHDTALVDDAEDDRLTQRTEPLEETEGFRTLRCFRR